MRPTPTTWGRPGRRGRGQRRPPPPRALGELTEKIPSSSATVSLAPAPWGDRRSVVRSGRCSLWSTAAAQSATSSCCRHRGVRRHLQPGWAGIARPDRCGGALRGRQPARPAPAVARQSSKAVRSPRRPPPRLLRASRSSLSGSSRCARAPACYADEPLQRSPGLRRPAPISHRRLARRHPLLPPQR